MTNEEARALRKSDFQAESNEGQLYGTTDYKSQEPGENVGRVTTEQLRRRRTIWNPLHSMEPPGNGQSHIHWRAFSGKVKKFLLILQQIFMAFLVHADTVLGGVNKTNAVPVIRHIFCDGTNNRQNDTKCALSKTRAQLQEKGSQRSLL